MPKTFPPEVAEALIAAVQKRECLYDTKNPSYRNRNVVELSWKAVANEVERDVAACKSMWASLRCTFNRNMAMQIKPSGSACCKEPKWPFFRSMLFLKQHVSHGSIVGNLADDTISQDSSALADDDTSVVIFADDNSQEEVLVLPGPSLEEPGPSMECSPAPTTAKGKGKKRKAPEDPVQEAVLEFINSKKQQQQQQPQEEKDIMFFKSLLPYFAMLSPVQQLQYMQQITGILLDMVASNTQL